MILSTETTRIYNGNKKSARTLASYVQRSYDVAVLAGCDSVGYVSVLLQDSCFTRAGHESSLTRIAKGNNDTAGRGREASVYGRINLLTGFTNRRHPVAR